MCDRFPRKFDVQTSYKHSNYVLRLIFVVNIKFPRATYHTIVPSTEELSSVCSWRPFWRSKTVSYLHKNKTFFPKERIYIVFLLQHGRCEHTLMFEYRYVSHKGYGFAAGVVCLVCLCFVVFFLREVFLTPKQIMGRRSLLLVLLGALTLGIPQSVGLCISVVSLDKHLCIKVYLYPGI